MGLPSMYLEADLLQAHLQRDLPLPTITANACRHHLTHLAQKYWRDIRWLEPNHGILSATFPACQPEGLKLQLFEYQARNLSW